jgi:hypothetical protein
MATNADSPAAVLLVQTTRAHAPFTHAPSPPNPVTAGKAATRDTSAAMVAASGMIELAWHSAPADRARYLAFVQTVLTSAMSPTYQFTPSESDAVLKNGTTAYPVTGVPIIYGAYGVAFGDGGGGKEAREGAQ